VLFVYDLKPICRGLFNFNSVKSLGGQLATKGQYGGQEVTILAVVSTITWPVSSIFVFLKLPFNDNDFYRFWLGGTTAISFTRDNFWLLGFHHMFQ